MSINTPNKPYTIAITLILLVLLGILCFDIFVKDGGIKQIISLRNKVLMQKRQLAELKAQNQTLGKYITDLHQHGQSYERQVRYETGLIKHHEKYFKLKKV